MYTRQSRNVSQFIFPFNRGYAFATIIRKHKYNVEKSVSLCKRINLKSNSFQNNFTFIKLFSNTGSMNETRYNEINLQMLSNNLYKQIFFRKDNYNSHSTSYDISSIKQEFARFGIDTECSSKIQDVNIKLPRFHGEDIEEHFKQIAQEQVQPYLNIISKMLNELPPIPKNFVLQEGWTCYSDNGYETVEFPNEDGLIFDVEVCIKHGPLPVLATAASNTSWYTWVSKCLTEGISSSYLKKLLTSDVLIPLESCQYDSGLDLNKFQQMPKIVVGHNVSYDRIRIKEQYWLQSTGTRFLDTMSLHISVSGTSSYQRAILKSNKPNVENNQLQSCSSLNNLADVHRLYCGSELDKTKRSIFETENLSQIKEKFNDLMTYCALDVVATHNVLKKIFPLFLERFPHPATLAGMLELGSAYLPVNNNWMRYLEEAETTYQDLNLESRMCLSKRADEVCRLLLSDRYKKDPWMWDEDWTIKDIKLKKGYDKIITNKRKSTSVTNEELDLSLKFAYLYETKQFLPKNLPHMPGYPEWYRKLCEKQSNLNLFPRAQKISTSMVVTPKLLNLTWDNHPLHYIKDYGWGFITSSKSKNLDTSSQYELIKHLDLPKVNKTFSKFNFTNTNKDLKTIPLKINLNSFGNDIISNNDTVSDYFFFKLPHKDGASFNVGSPLSKDFLNKFSENVLQGIDKSATRILEISKLCSYWKNTRDRILSQLVIWLDSNQLNLAVKKNTSTINFGAIIPQIVVSGTLTRRAVESTWMTASNAHHERVGSELRGMINVPFNYNIVGADVDSQELWIASIIGDAFSKNIKIHGATPFSWMTLIGNKSDGNDMHSVTAKAIGISRDQAKIINYARIYGAGQRFAERLLKQFNPTMSDKEASLKSKKMFSMTKGQKLFHLKKQYLTEDCINRLYTLTETLRICQLYGKSREEIFERGKWIGGSESAMFNSLEEIAWKKHPITPFLNARLSRALENESNEKYLPTKINWVVQSAAVDFLHLLLVCMRWLMKDKAKFCLSFHDEVRYLVPSKYKYNAALAMHVTNLLVRCFFVSRLQMKDLPMSVAFFTAVEIDTVLRKEANQDCKTPSNPHGLSEGYGICNGESLNVFAAIEKSKGCVGILDNKLK